MNTTKSERKSRRSSILKPPKPRVPLQNVELDVSSNENSPATNKTKVKRRVSFAEKKHVKEFCDSPEQGTVWDNTYEESESGQIKLNKNSRNDENLDSDEWGKNDPTLIRERISIVTESVVSITQSMDTEISKASDDEIRLGDSMGDRAHMMSSGILFPSWSFHSQKSLLVTETSAGNSADTENRSADRCPAEASGVGIVNVDPINFCPTLQHDDCTEVPIAETLKTQDSSVELELESMHRLDDAGILKGNQSKIIVYHDDSMETIETPLNRTSLISKQPNELIDKESNKNALLVAEQKTTFQMETVETVTKILGIFGTGFKELKPTEVNLRPERMPIFYHKHSELIENTLNVSSTQQLKKLQSEEPQSTTPEQIKLFHDESAGLQDAVSNILSIDQLNELHSERSKILHKQHVGCPKLTENIPNIGNTEISSQERTEVFHNKSLDLTGVIGQGLSFRQEQQTTPEKTKLLNQPVDITGVIHSGHKYETWKNLPDEKTTIFHNQSVDMTEVIQSDQRYDYPLKLPEEKTTIFHNQSVDMTGVIETGRGNDNPLKLPEDKTTVFHDQSIDMTGVVQTGWGYENPLKLPEDKTTIFHNQSIDMTGVVQSGQGYSNPLTLPEEKTTIFHNQSVDITGIVQSRQRYENPLKLPEEKTTIFHNQSVEMTGVVQSRRHYENQPKLAEEKTTIFHNQSVDMTEVVESGQRTENPQKLPEEKTTIFHNQSVDMTGVVQFGQRNENSQKIPEEKTTIFHNQSVEMTGIVQHDQRYENLSKLSEEKTTIFHNESIEMTGVVEGNRNYDDPVKLPQEKTTIFHNQSMETTRMVPSSLSSRNPINQFREREISHSKPQDPSESQNSSLYLGNVEIKNKNERLANPSRTEADCQIPGVSKFLSRDSCTLAVERMTKHKSVKFKEANQHVASIEAKNSDPEVRSPVPKKMKSTEGSLSNIDPKVKFPTKRVQLTRQFAQDEPVNIENTSREMAAVDGNSYSLKCAEFIDDPMEITSVIPGIIQANTATAYGESMQRISEKAYGSNAQILPETNENLGSQVDPHSKNSPAGNDKTTVFRDDLMELTKAVQLTSQLAERNNSVAKEGNNFSMNGILQLERDARTKVYRNDSMAITRAVPPSRQPQLDDLDKENCPIGMEGLQSYNSRRSNRRGDGVSRNELLEIMKSVPFISSQEAQSQMERDELEQQRVDIGSEEITGVVPFMEHVDHENEELEMEMTEHSRCSSGITLEKNKNLREFPEMETFSPATKNRSSTAAKELFQKLDPIQRDETLTANLKDHSETPDLDAEIRKLSDNFVHSDPVDETGFDQATFLEQQARCMEDYEANSTASQEYNSRSISTRKHELLTEKRDSPDPGIFNNPKDRSADDRCALSITCSAVSRDLKTENILACNKNDSAAQNNFVIDDGHDDKSLEVLRDRAYSVSKFRPEVTGFEFTAGMITADAEELDELIAAVEPPSLLFNDIIMSDSVSNATATSSVNESSIDKEKMQTSRSINVLPAITKTMELLREDTMEVSRIIGVPELTMNADIHTIECTINLDAEKPLETSTEEHRRRTYVIKRPNSDSTIPITSPRDTVRDTNNDRLSGVTTASEFSTESPNGPHEKLRRQEIDSTNKSNEIPTTSTVENVTESNEVPQSWRKREYFNSTVIGDDYTRQFVHPGLQDISMTLETSSCDELPFEIATNFEKVTSSRHDFNNTNQSVIELHISVPKSPFVVFKETVENLATSPETIWIIQRFDEKMVVFNFFSKTIALVIYFDDEANSNTTISPIKKIALLSQLVEVDSDAGVCLAHSLIMKKVNPANLKDSYQTFEDVPRLLEYVSGEVKLGMDFMFDLDRLRNRNVMEIHENRISFMIRTRDINAGIILNITLVVKPFEQINSNDISVEYVLGRDKVREHDIKRLITNVKRDHRFLRFYINDVKDYLDLMAETGYSNRQQFN